MSRRTGRRGTAAAFMSAAAAALAALVLIVVALSGNDEAVAAGATTTTSSPTSSPTSTTSTTATGSPTPTSSSTTSASPSQPTATPTPPAVQLPHRRFTLAGVHVNLATRRTGQLVTVNTAGTHAHVIFWRWGHGRWNKKMDTRAGRVGYSGVVAGDQRHQGTGKTPLGTYPLLFTFGSNPHRAGWNMPYKHYGPSDYWVEDNHSAYYNRYRSRTQGGFRWWLDPNSVDGSERLADYQRQYEMAVVIGYNYFDRVRYRGAGIFLHVNGHGATSGCVSAPRAFLAGTFARLTPNLHPVIAIGR